jgi:hypothetical protein
MIYLLVFLIGVISTLCFTIFYYNFVVNKYIKEKEAEELKQDEEYYQAMLKLFPNELQ